MVKGAPIDPRDADARKVPNFSAAGAKRDLAHRKGFESSSEQGCGAETSDWPPSLSSSCCLSTTVASSSTFGWDDAPQPFLLSNSPLLAIASAAVY
jgi:hypothetical protein